MIFGVTYTCPHCGHVHAYTTSVEEKRTTLVWYCDPDNGGCDKRNVIDIELYARVYAYPVMEGNEND